jgi:uncharacterized membrane protein
MSTSPFYPQPPRLMVQVWTPRPPVEAFAAVSLALEVSGARPLGAVETASVGATFARDGADEAAARRTATWSLDLPWRMVTDAGALYGTVTVESPMPTPAQLAAGPG